MMDRGSAHLTPIMSPSSLTMGPDFSHPLRTVSPPPEYRGVKVTAPEARRR